MKVKQLMYLLMKIKRDWDSLSEEEQTDYFYDTGVIGFLENYDDYVQLEKELSEDEFYLLTTMFCKHLVDDED